MLHEDLLEPAPRDTSLTFTRRRVACASVRECCLNAEGIYAQGRRAQFGGRSRRKGSTVAYACRQSEVASATLAP